MDSTTNQGFWLRIPLVVPMTYANEQHSVYLNERLYDGWLLWDNFRQYCGHKYKLSIALELSSCDEILSSSEDELQTPTTDGKTRKASIFSADYLSRWAAEPVRAIIIDCSLFITNKSGYPVLPKSYQRVLNYFLKYPVQIILSGKPTNNPKSHDLEGLLAYKNYVQYLRHLKFKCATAAGLSDADRYTNAYNDTLQIPLQPLMDNLEVSLRLFTLQNRFSRSYIDFPVDHLIIISFSFRLCTVANVRNVRKRSYKICEV